jgi:pimeloyl-ACP methyl ester carboxylesterase
VYVGAGARWNAPADPTVREIERGTTPHDRVVHLWLPHRTPERAPVIVFFHGNGENASDVVSLGGDLRATFDASVLLIDYPGYGRSSGTPSEEGCYAAADDGIRWLREENAIEHGRMILFGSSLGGGVAAEMALRYPCRCLVLLSTFTSLPDAAKSLFPVLPTRTFMSNRFDTQNKIGHLTCPIVVAHGTDDGTVPYHHGERLYELAQGRKDFLRLDGWWRGKIWRGDNCLNPELYSKLKPLLDRLTK